MLDKGKVVTQLFK